MNQAPPIRVPIVAVDKLTAGVQKIAAKIAVITAPLSALQNKIVKLTSLSGVDKLGAAANRVGKSFRNLYGTVAGIVTKIGMVGAAAGGGLFALVKTTSDFGDEVATVAGNMGLTVEALQELRYAAVKSDVEVQDMENAIFRLQRAAGEAATGQGKNADLFNALGVSIRGAGGQMKDTEQLFTETIAAMNKIKNPVTRNKVAFDLFSRAGSSRPRVRG